MKNITLAALILMSLTFVSCGGKDKSSGSSSSGFSNSVNSNGYSTGTFQNKSGTLNEQTGVFTFGSQTFSPQQVTQSSFQVINAALQQAKTGNIIALQSSTGVIYRVNVSAALSTYNGTQGLDIRTMSVVNYK